MNAISFLGDHGRENELLQALAGELGALEKSASVSQQETVMASVVATLVKCAESLEQVGHPAAGKVDEVLGFIEKEMFSQE